jgi:hypothetical protein
MPENGEKAIKFIMAKTCGEMTSKKGGLAKKKSAATAMAF